MTEMITVVGRVATDPHQGHTGARVPVTNFRLASTHRRFEPTTQTWVDSETNWFSVAAFRQLGQNARASLRVGDSIVVTGRLRIRAWESNGKQGTSADIEADAIGHDLRWGTTAFRPSPRRSPETVAEGEKDGEQSPGADSASGSARTTASGRTGDDLGDLWGIDGSGDGGAATDQAFPDGFLGAGARVSAGQ
ncbi:single-stranded DNA-binding protein [Microbacterium sp. K41]|uniref:single-stranded DNA-binding protein n=1 Tax=Microbacterium sp. K41 TaxID=2305437 RepID=UPI00109C64CC|nr:single-stranded DNA-binding protein [Microbacterium sp. K41]